ncbi:hypothetical protein SAMN05444285_11610 [Draconibacterium orientale]|uniref:Uncharacterized protein n=1 Tax=Draconibacterium orientale TaxID=1168034 RepID=X5E4C2_9BACT|nr:hypothetical protein [Draconibacterium orientale]AHW62300.1 hypothetical protein FH5T_19260 [Draconibacterium orientale]SET54795.1 hypothetical protein SAMN05444285_11610 [Draconibacterium orientale]
MKRLIEIADQLNILLNTESLDIPLLNKLALELSQTSNPRIKLLDFEKYNEENLAKLTAEKFTKIKEQDFEAGANAREQEKECLKYTKFQKYFKLKNSFFYPEDDKLFYFYLGTEKNDKLIKASLFEE